MAELTDRATELIKAALDALDPLADSGDGAARHAAAILRGQRRAGRPRMDDREALAEVERLSAGGRCRDAVSIVANRLGQTSSERVAIAVRLRRKRRMKRTK
jgi:hypothetical protein